MSLVPPPWLELTTSEPFFKATRVSPPGTMRMRSWYANANGVLVEARQGILARGLEAPGVRCWPHHFDLDTLVTLDGGAGTLGIGFEPGDEYYDQPYFYVSRHPQPAIATLPPLRGIGHWHTHHFTAAVAVADQILQADDPRAATADFVSSAADILIGR